MEYYERPHKRKHLGSPNWQTLVAILRFLLRGVHGCSLLPWTFRDGLKSLQEVSGTSSNNSVGRLLQWIATAGVTIHCRGRKYWLRSIVMVQGTKPYAGHTLCQALWKSLHMYYVSNSHDDPLKSIVSLSAPLYRPGNWGSTSLIIYQRSICHTVMKTLDFYFIYVLIRYVTGSKEIHLITIWDTTLWKTSTLSLMITAGKWSKEWFLWFSFNGHMI